MKLLFNKILAIILAASMLAIFPAYTADAEKSDLLISSVRCDGNLISIKGRAGTSQDFVTVKVLSPENKISYINQIKAQENGEISIEYSFGKNAMHGRYNVYLLCGSESAASFYTYSGAETETAVNETVTLFYDENGYKLSSIPLNGAVIADYNGEKAKNESKLILALYSETSQLINVAEGTVSQPPELNVKNGAGTVLKAFVYENNENIKPLDEVSEISYGGILREATALKIDELKAKESSLTYSKLYSGTSGYSLKWDIGQDIYISKYFDTEIADGTAGSNGIYGNYKDLSPFNTIEFKLYSPVQTNSGYIISIRTKGGINGTYNGIIDWKGWKTLSLNFDSDFVLSNECSPKIADENYTFTPENAVVCLQIPAENKVNSEAELYFDDVKLKYISPRRVNKYSDEDFIKARENWIKKLIGTGDYSGATDSQIISKLNALNTSAYTYKSAQEIMNKFPRTSDGDKGLRLSNIYSAVVKMAKAYNTKGIAAYKDDNVKKVIFDTLEACYNDSEGYGVYVINDIDASTAWGNWWYWQIAVPGFLTDILMLMKDEMTEEMLYKYMEPMEILVKETVGVGANRLWTAYIMVGCGILKHNYEPVYKAQAEVEGEFFYRTSGEGIYADGSFIQHGGVSYNFGYGLNFYSEFTHLIDVLSGTAFSFLEWQEAKLPEWGINNFIPFVYESKVSALTTGRNVTRGNSLYSGCVDLVKCLLSAINYADENQKAIITDFIKKNSAVKIKNGLDFYHIEDYNSILEETGTPTETGNNAKIFAAMDRAVFEQDKFRMELAMSSKRIKRYESILSENTKGWYHGDGMTYLYTDSLGTAFDSEWVSNADMHKIPGTTETDVPRTAEVFSSGGNDLLLLAYNDYAGGVAMDNYGVSAMQHIAYKNTENTELSTVTENLEAKKGYFVFDDEILCLGSDINHSGDYNVYTWLENRKTDETFFVNGNSATEGETENVSSVNIGNKLGYYFPYGEKINFRKNNSYLEVGLSHGSNFEGGKYAYIILPEKNAAETQNYVSEISILQNDGKIQAAKKGNILEAVFYEPGICGDFEVSEGIILIAKETDSGSLKIAVSDPTHKLDSAVIRIHKPLTETVLADKETNVLISENSTDIRVDFTNSRGKTFYAELK
ncbi:MAG: hypothetical protein IJC74_06715 [Clostridia bacterium]|nr:hypothetical protein [Clostridia bacterium]